MSSPRSIARAAARGNQSTSAQRLSRTRNLRKDGRVYLASSLHTYATPEYSRYLNTLAGLLPDAKILPARDLFRSNDDWRHRWPDILPTLDALVYVEDRDGYIGRAVYTEIIDALAQGIPVRYLAPAGHLYELATEDDGEPVLTAFHPFDWRQFAQLAYRMPGDEALALLHDGEKGGA